MDPWAVSVSPLRHKFYFKNHKDRSKTLCAQNNDLQKRCDKELKVLNNLSKVSANEIRAQQLLLVRRKEQLTKKKKTFAQKDKKNNEILDKFELQHQTNEYRLHNPACESRPDTASTSSEEHGDVKREYGIQWGDPNSGCLKDNGETRKRKDTDTQTVISVSISTRDKTSHNCSS